MVFFETLFIELLTKNKTQHFLSGSHIKKHKTKI